MTNLFFLFFVIFLEGYVVLSAELLAIRLAIPYVGSGTDTVSIIIAAVLMPLAVGYYAGGNFQKYKSIGSELITVRKKLLRNIFVAALFLLFGLSYFSVSFFFEGLNQNGIHNRLLTAAIYACVFLITPVYLLAQTIPLVSHFFRKERLSLITGKMLFFSTVGSFMGAIFSTLVLMAFIGVHYTAVLTIGCLVVLHVALSRKLFSKNNFIMVLILLGAIVMNSEYILRADHVVSNNKYNTIKVMALGKGHMRILSMNNNNSSVYIDTEAIKETSPYARSTQGYADYINTNFIDPIIGDPNIRDFLIIGAGGFTLGIDDDTNNYTYIDIDGSLKDISEEHFLKKDLTPNKKFEATPARSFINTAIHNDKKFDMIIVDAYLGNQTLPEHLVTQEFYASVRQILEEDGIMIANFIMPVDFSTVFSVKVDNTLRRVFPHLTRHIVKDFDAWNSRELFNSNVLYIYYNRKEDILDYYTDNKNHVYYDRDKKVE